jgi:hypothetical protein
MSNEGEGIIAIESAASSCVTRVRETDHFVEPKVERAVRRDVYNQDM